MYGNAVQSIVIVGKFRHKGLRRLYEDDNPRGVPAHPVRQPADYLQASGQYRHRSELWGLSL